MFLKLWLMRIPFLQLPKHRVFNLSVSEPSMASVSASYNGVMKNRRGTLIYLCPTVSLLNMPVSQKQINF